MRHRPAGPDEYFPRFGDDSYDVLHYDLQLDYRVDGNHLEGRAELHAIALMDLDQLHVDLHGLKVSRVRLDVGQVSKFRASGNKLVVRTKEVMERGREFRLVVRYAGRPRPIADGDGGMGWEELTEGVLVAGQTNGAATWFPCNDRLTNKASYRIEVTTASAYRVVANGLLTSQRVAAGTTTWVYEQAEPMATYLATVQIGPYASLDIASTPVPMRAALPEGRLADYDAGFGQQPAMMDLFVRSFGPYPFNAYTVVITEDPLEIPLEAQSMAVFGSNFLNDGWDSVRLIAHEMAHQWFGNSVTAAAWRHIWLHEGFACYAEWLWSEESGGPSADDQAKRHWKLLSGAAQDLVLADPGPDDMFDDRVYKRGALLLHALRVTVGDETFFTLLRRWARDHAYGSVTTEMFVDLASELAGQPLNSLFDRWLNEKELPALPRRSA